MGNPLSDEAEQSDYMMRCDGYGLWRQFKCLMLRLIKATVCCSHAGAIHQLGRQQCVHCSSAIVVWWALWRCKTCGRIDPKLSLNCQFRVLRAEEALPQYNTASCCQAPVVGLEVSLAPPYYWLPFSFLLVEELALVKSASAQGLGQYYSRLVTSIQCLGQGLLNGQAIHKRL